ncbi:lipopolysaccharide export system protein LptA [Rhodobacter aestuarii]|uniref:Lipopolysaccharide export system protein LptA n=1 Tax=Rhodobacter aestuarii TaxID=453582 RepID=A0A1N7QEM7_9RHOB|nr:MULTISPECIES: lipopolysaccharide transport periplasmic protein LptA [Rhodobacter]PTV93523.1 lipopolysaccharide export system protein LptA [Rhodobacter aestuarii]SIT21298.1 lipopolysaccharide export system protein LptA [Rhodobacter aestuarii]SOC08411.1 lipopolysaccharide export system protein LptA [Rhodobacter sp. JA431]
MRRLPQIFSALIFFSLTAGAVQAQQVAFAGLRTDTSEPVEVTADSLDVNQTDGNAIFTGNVVIIQGPLRLSAARVQVEYGSAEKKSISELQASGGVTLVTASEAAESRDAVYNVAAGSVVMTGDVLLTQGDNVLSGQRLDVDLKTGTGQMQGRVRTVLQPDQTP